MRLKDLLIAAAVVVGVIIVVVVYGTWPRIGNRIVSQKTYREAVLATNTADRLLDNEDFRVEPMEPEPLFEPAAPAPAPKSPPRAEPPPRDGKENCATMVRALRAMVIEESGGNPNAVGDRHMKNKAYGVLQIRKPYLDDVNSFARKRVIATWGRLLTMADMKDPDKAWWVAVEYLTHYGRHYQKQTGRHPDIRVYAAIHNGGPDGWQEPCTIGYSNRVVARVASF